MYCLIALAVTLSYVLHLYIQSLFTTTTCSYSLRLSLLIYLTKTHSRIHMLPIHVHTLTYTRTYTHTVTWILKVWQPGESYPPGPPLLWGRWTRVSSTLNSLQCSLSVGSFFFSFLCMCNTFTPFFLSHLYLPSLYLFFSLSSPLFHHLTLILPHPLSVSSHTLPTILEIQYCLSTKCHYNLFTPFFILVQCPLTYVTRTSDPWTKHSWDSPSSMTLHH